MESARALPATVGAETYGVLARSVPARLVEISRSGCLLESRQPVEVGVVGELRLHSGAELIADDVRVTRCVKVEGSGSSYLVGAEFVQTRRAGEGSIRRAITAILRSVAQHDRQPVTVAVRKTVKNGINVLQTGEGEGDRS